MTTAFADGISLPQFIDSDLIMTSINLLPEDLRKREKHHKHKDSQKPEMEFVHHSQETAPVVASLKVPEDYRKMPQNVPLQPPARQTSPQQPSPLLSQKSKGGFLGKLQEKFTTLSRRGRMEQKKGNSPVLATKEEVKKKPAPSKAPQAKKFDFKNFFKHGAIKRLFTKQKKTEESEDHVDVNLLKEEIALQRSFKPEIIKLAALAGLLLVLTYLVGFYYQSQSGSLKNELAKLDEQLNNLKLQQAVIIAQGEKMKGVDAYIEAVYMLVKNRINWSLFLDAVEKRTFSTVYYQTLNAIDLGRVVVIARAQSITDALAQVKFFERDPGFAQDVQLVSLQPRQVEEIIPGEEGRTYITSFVDFTFAFTVNPEWLEKSTQGIAL